MTDEPKAGAAPAKAAKKKHEPTKRTVLKREAVLVLPPDVKTEALLAAARALGIKGAPREGEAWIVVGEFDGNSKDDSIEAYTGPAGEHDTKTGTFKAVPAKSFAGGVKLTAPAKPRVEKESIA